MIPLGTGGSYSIRRGVVGNYGAQKLLFPASGPLREYLSHIPLTWLRPGLDNADLMTQGGVMPSQAQVPVLAPPPSAFLAGTEDNRRLLKLVDIFRQRHKPSGSQSSRTPSVYELVETLNKSLVSVQGGSVAYPRLVRKRLSVYLLTAPTYVSTNFVVIHPIGPDALDAPTLCAWLRSPFSAVERFAKDKNQEGASKIEVAGVKDLRVPTRKNLAGYGVTESELASLPFLNLSRPAASPVDHDLAQALWMEDAHKAIEESLEVISDFYIERTT